MSAHLKLYTVFIVETFCGMVWTGQKDFFSHDDLDAALFDTEEEAIEASAHLNEVYVEPVLRGFSRPDITVSTSTEERRSAAA